MVSTNMNKYLQQNKEEFLELDTKNLQEAQIRDIDIEKRYVG